MAQMDALALEAAEEAVSYTHLDVYKRQGHIIIAGEDAATFSEKQLNRLFSIVQQEVFLFNLSMEENIRIGKPEASMEEIIAAAKKARIHDFIMSLPNGYQLSLIHI